MHPVNGTGNTPSPGQPTPGVIKQDNSSRGSVDTTKTRSGPQRVRMSSGERPRGATKGKQPNTEALCQTPPNCSVAQRGLEPPTGMGLWPTVPRPPSARMAFPDGDRGLFLGRGQALRAPCHGAWDQRLAAPEVDRVWATPLPPLPRLVRIPWTIPGAQNSGGDRHQPTVVGVHLGG